MAQQAEIAQLLYSGIGSPQRSQYPASACTTPTHASPHVPLTQRRFTTPTSDQTPDPEPALHPHLRSASTDHDPPPPPGLPSGQTLGQELLQTPTPEQPAAVHSAPAVLIPSTRSRTRLRRSPAAILPEVTAQPPRIGTTSHFIGSRKSMKPCNSLFSVR